MHVEQLKKIKSQLSPVIVYSLQTAMRQMRVLKLENRINLRVWHFDPWPDPNCCWPSDPWPYAAMRQSDDQDMQLSPSASASRYNAVAYLT